MKKSFSLQNQLRQVWRAITRLRVVLFMLALVALYGFVGWRMRDLASAQPDEQAISSQTTAEPQIDSDLVDKIKQLEESNITVKSLFDEARSNPFRE